MARVELATWMTPMDRDILECLWNPGNSELVLSPRLIAENTDWGRDAVRSHMLKLREHGLVEYYDEDGGIYQLSDRGREWLEGELPTEELED
ncbi:helix-turn-helix domain-containing protein [Halobacterium hubeiense]|uniref:ArsR family transcriptional regulator n=1 Tax=Halobacterium hubeiense TaxID=1407499 RepID=UPI001C4F3815|nr:ArsR family transcriptional regulator [Halobacterium hubeiense]